ncbi:NAD(P)-dependent oxidoreductase [Inquilinus limosus]|uniref:NAD(P)-dependent oxidoreductase n=1 Tax=Inquilinus limosus TaxID=171674 RepID=UPI003F16A437
MKRIAFIGLGAMGGPMARNLLKRGFPVRGFDLDPRALAELRDAGGLAAASAAEACADADMVVLMVVDARQAEAVLFSEGALAAMPAGALVCLMATCPPRAVEAIAARVTAAGRRFVDAPVSGGTAGATAGTLTVMAAAPAAVFEAVRPVLAALGDRIFHVGERPGQAAMVKTVNQLLCGVHIAAAAEAVALAGKVGVDAGTLIEILSGTSASSWMLRDRGPRMIQDDPAVSSAVDIFVKDLGIVLEAGRETGAALPLAALSHQLFLSTSGRGDGRADDSQVIRAYRALNGG